MGIEPPDDEPSGSRRRGGPREEVRRLAVGWQQAAEPVEERGQVDLDESPHEVVVDGGVAVRQDVPEADDSREFDDAVAGSTFASLLRAS